MQRLKKKPTEEVIEEPIENEINRVPLSEEEIKEENQSFGG